MNYFLKYFFLLLLVVIFFSKGLAIHIDSESYNINNTIVDKNIDKGESILNVVDDPPVADFTFTNNNSCSGTVIQFTPNVTGTGPFTYTWNFGDGQTSIAKNPTHKFDALGCGTQSFSVSLTVSKDTLTSSKSKQISVIQKPDISFYDKYAEIGDENFNNCSEASIENPNYSITVENNSASKACIGSYSIAWGDGSSKTDVTFPITHEYATLGAFNMVITAKGSNNCENSILYVVKNQTNPSGGITSPGTTQDLCAPTNELEFAISGWGTNSPGTSYLVNYGDGSEIQITQEEMMADTSYFNEADPASSTNFPIPHSYSTSSCPSPSFTVNLTIINACSETPAAVGNITIITKPEPDFSASPTCVNSNTLFTNKTISGDGKNCASNSNFTWDFGDGSPIVEQKNTLPQNIEHTYTTSGTYNVTLTALNNTICGENSITKPITISSPPTATISGGADVCLGDAPPAITFIGADGNTPYSFEYKTNNGATQTITTAASDNSVTIQAPTNVAGTFTYSLISVSSSSCSQSQTGTAVVIVNPALTATITGTDSICINEASPLITLTGINGTPPYIFTYNINGGTNQTKTTMAGDTVIIQVPTNSGGEFKYNLIDVEDAGSNPCVLTQSGFATITINDQPPELMTLDDYEFCNGEITPIISFSNPVPGTTYTWTNSNPSIGLAGNGLGNIPAFSAINNTPNPISTIITVIPSANGCNGESQTFTITVNSSASVTFSETDQTICSGESSTKVLLSSSTPGAKLSWTTEQPPEINETLTLSGTDTIQSQTFTNTTNAPISVIYKAKATSTGATTCSGIEFLCTITVNPKPSITGSLTDTICSGTSFSISPANDGSNVIPTETKYSWNEPIISTADAIAGTSEQITPQSIISQTLTNTSTSIATATYSVTPIINGCEGNSFDVIVFVIPGAISVPVNNIILCNGETNAEIDFTNNQAGATYSWSTSNVNIGMASSSGIDKIPEFTAINNGTSPITAIVTITSSSDFGNSICSGTQVQFSITVNPTALVNNPGDFNTCVGQDISINFNNDNTGGSTSFKWTNSNSNIGLATSGEGDISFSPINTGDTVAYTSISVTPFFESDGITCRGTSEFFSIIINPNPTVDQPTDQTICSGNKTSEIIFYGNNPNIIYNWSINNTSVGLPSNGTGDIPEYLVENNDFDSVVAIVTVIPNLNGCDGTPNVFSIVVHPTAFVLKQPSPSTICLGNKPTPLSVIHTNGAGTPFYQWYSNTLNSTNGGTKILNENGSNYNPPSELTNSTYYYCVISFSSGGCSNLTTEIAKITVNPNPVIVLNDEKISKGEELKICPDGEIPIKVRGAETFKWSYGFLGDSVLITDIGDYRVIGISEIGCMDTFPFSASYYDFWNYTIESDKEEVTNDQSPISFSTKDIPGSFYNWDFGDGTTAYGNKTKHIFDITEDGYFEVKLTVENPHGCFEEATKQFWVSLTSIPNTFTPNGDGINDIFMKGWKIQIFNRNGILMYEGDEGWDGTYKGKPAANATYLYILYDYSELGAKSKPKTVTILR